jgi:hypothetical protein
MRGATRPRRRPRVCQGRKIDDGNALRQAMIYLLRNPVIREA